LERCGGLQSLAETACGFFNVVDVDDSIFANLVNGCLQEHHSVTEGHSRSCIAACFKGDVSTLVNVKALLLGTCTGKPRFDSVDSGQEANTHCAFQCLSGVVGRIVACELWSFIGSDGQAWLVELGCTNGGEESNSITACEEDDTINTGGLEVVYRSPGSGTEGRRQWCRG